MAKEEAEKEEAAEGEEGEGKKKIGGKKLIIIIAAAVLLLGGGGAGAYFAGLLPFGKPKDEKAEEGKEEEKSGEHGEKAEGGHGEKKEGAPTVPGAPVFYNLPEFLVNLNSGPLGKTSFIKMKVSLQLPSQAEVAVVEANLPRIQDSFNTYLRELRASDLSGSAGMYRLREELLLRINKMLAPSKVDNILFQDILVQ